MKVALVYDRVNKWGGAERVLLALHKIFPDAPLYTSVYNPKTADWAKVFKIKTSFLQNFPKAKISHELYAGLMPLAFESFDFSEFDLVISVTSEAAKGIITKPNTKHICYCLTPTRYLWSGYENYFKNKILKIVTKPLVKYLRAWDLAASKRPDLMIAISTEVKERIAKYYGLKSEVIYPPLMIEESNKSENKGEYFLLVSRLTNYYKRVDLAIRACAKLSLPLKIVGSGKDEENLRKIAGKTIEFFGNVEDADLAKYYKNCKALIFPGLEDFGLVMAEAQYFGKPVIAFGKGGARDIVKEKITGEFFNEQNVDSLCQVLKNFNENSYNSNSCKENAERFSFEHFRNSILALV